VRRTEEDGYDAATFGVELETAEPEYRYREAPGRPEYPSLMPFETDPAALDRYMAARDVWDAWRLKNDAYQAEQERKFRSQGDMSGDEAVSMAAPRSLWHAKSDSSVTGPEFASHPATLAYWQSQYPAIASMFQSLLHGGMRSHDGDTCGLHVNIGTASFGGNEGHLYRFATLVHASPKWAMRMSQRTAESSSHWAQFTLKDEAKRRLWARQVARYGYCSEFDRYSVLNAQNEQRIEFRLPRGTLRVDRFYAKLEWTASMVEYTRDETNEPTVASYMAWVIRGNEYPALSAYLTERFASRLAAAVVEV
jgi:hypothetical protein